MIIKTYKAKTNVSINVVLPSKKNLHISFIPLSDGSSVFTTDNAEIQKAIEGHYNFNNLFILAGERRTDVPKPKAKAPSPVESGSESEEEKATSTPGIPTPVADENVSCKSGSEDEISDKDENNAIEEEDGLRKVKVTDIAAAKDYLADTFGISRTSMRSTKSILEKAAEHGIEFEGL